MSTTMACYSKHKKPVCDWCDAGTSCVKHCIVSTPPSRTWSTKEKKINRSLNLVHTYNSMLFWNMQFEPITTTMFHRNNNVPSQQQCSIATTTSHHDNNVAAETPAKEDLWFAKVSSSQAYTLDVLEADGL